MEIRKLIRGSLQPDNGLLAHRLLPWTELNAPFEGAWCVIKPGTSSNAHSHHEYEIFIAMSGSATLESDGKRSEFNAGDVAYFKPGQDHQVINDTDFDFQMYGVWWDAEMTERFVARHEGGQAR
ncbi:MAG: cupin domain-containing protein [Pseudonocardiaceae bacterium]